MLTRSPGRVMPRVVMASVWGMSMTENASGQTSTRVRLTPSTAIEPLETRSGVQLGVDPKGEEFPLPLLAPLAEDGGGVDMTLDKMSAQAVAHFQRPLEVDAIAGLLVSQVGSGQGLRARPGPRTVVAGGRDDGQAAAVHRHAFAEFQRLAAGQARPDDRQSAAAVLLDNPLEPAQAFDQSREHAQALRSWIAARPLVPAVDGRQPIDAVSSLLDLVLW